jgi:hypothetical protein
MLKNASAIAAIVFVLLGAKEPSQAPIEQIEIAPLFYKPFACIDHPAGQPTDLGDALGTDCMIVGGFQPSSGFLRFYAGDGARNDEWYGWHADVHAPFDAVVTEVRTNPVTNIPGLMGKPPASYIAFRRADGAVVVYAHVDAIRVKVGDTVAMGQVVAIDGNNGTARMPHVHVGAYRAGKPLQIRWDLAAEGRIPTLLGK